MRAKITLVALFVLLLIPSAFAAWQELAGLALITSLILLALMYAIGIGFENEEIKALSKEELYQLIVLAVLIVVLIGGDGILDAISRNSDLARGQPTLQAAALTSLSETLINLSIYLDNISAIDEEISKAASQGLSCQIAGGGYSVSGCGGYSVMGTPFSLAGSVIGYGIAEVAAIQKLIQLSTDFALVLLLPLGIVLRTFRFTRGAGGFLIALGISLYIFVPLGIIFVDMLDEQFLGDPASGSEMYTHPVKDINIDCDPGSVVAESFGPMKSTEDQAVNTYHELRADINSYLHIVLIKATLGPIVALFMFIGALRALSSLFGSEVDVSSIARFV